MNDIRICDKCKATNVKTLIPKLNKLNKEIKITVGCQNMCGIGMKKSFAIVNHIPVIAETEDELVKKIDQVIK